jgi:hypothetical protein
LDATEVKPMTRVSGLAGSVVQVLDDGLRLLHPEPGVFNAMIEGWCRQQRSVTHVLVLYYVAHQMHSHDRETCMVPFYGEV